MSAKTKAMILACKIVFGLCFLNFATFLIGAVYLGGDALNGGFRDGRYLLMSHGVYREVSKEVFDYSRGHARSIWITHPLAFVAGAVAMNLQQRALARK